MYLIIVFRFVISIVTFAYLNLKSDTKHVKFTEILFYTVEEIPVFYLYESMNH